MQTSQFLFYLNHLFIYLFLLRFRLKFSCFVWPLQREDCSWILYRERIVAEYCTGRVSQLNALQRLNRMSLILYSERMHLSTYSYSIKEYFTTRESQLNTVGGWLLIFFYSERIAAGCFTAIEPQLHTLQWKDRSWLLCSDRSVAVKMQENDSWILNSDSWMREDCSWILYTG